MTEEIIDEINNVQEDVQSLASGYSNAGVDTAPLKQADEHLEQAKFEVIEFDAAVTPEEAPIEESVYDHGKEEELVAQAQG